jgi:hypothetical protein
LTTVNTGIGSAANTVNVGSLAPSTSGNVNGIAGKLVVNGQSTGTETLFVDESGDSGSNTGVLTSTLLTGLGMGSGIEYHGFDILNIGLGTGADTLSIESTVAQTTINTGAVAANTINVGSLAPAQGGVVDQIQGALRVIGHGKDTLNVDDSGSAARKDGVLTPTTLTGLNMGASGITFSGLSRLDVRLGSGAGSPIGNTLTVLDINPLTHVSADGGTSGNDSAVLRASGDFDGELDFTSFEHIGVTANGDFNGVVDDTASGHTEQIVIGGSLGINGHVIAVIIDNLSIGGDLVGTVTVAQTLSNLNVGGNLSGSVTESGTIDSLTIGGALTSSGVVNAVNAADPTQANIHTLRIAGDLSGDINVSGAVTSLTVIEGSLAASGRVLTDHLDRLVIGGDLAGTVKAEQALTTLEVGRDVSGMVWESGTIDSVTIGGSLTSTGQIDAMNFADPSQANINNLSIVHDLAGQVNAMGTVHSLNVLDGSITPGAWLDFSILDSLIIGPDGLSVGQNFAGMLTVEGNLGSMRVAGGMPGWLQAGYIGNIAVYGGFGPVVLRYMEHGVERQVEMATASVPFPLPDYNATAGSEYVNVQYFYEGTMTRASGTLANPQWTGRITNNVSAAPGQYDLSLVTYNDFAKFNLARLDAIGVAGVHNIAVEGDVLVKVSTPAAAFFPGFSYAAGIRLPLDRLAGIGVRDFIPDNTIQVKSLQAIAFGSHRTWYGRIETGAKASGNDAKSLLVKGTAMVLGNDTYRVPFSDVATQRVQLFTVTDKKGGKFESKGVVLTVQGVTAPNSTLKANVMTASNSARGAVTALVRYVRTFDKYRQNSNSVLQSIDLWGDGGSIETKANVSSTFSITSAGALGDVSLSKSQSLFNLTAPSIFGSLRIGGGITGVVQTTGLRIDPITLLTSTVNADFGRIYVDTSGRTPILTSTEIRTRGLSGKLVSRGNLISGVLTSGGVFTGEIDVQGDFGALLSPSGSLLAKSVGGLFIDGPLKGNIVVLGQILGGMQLNYGLTGGHIAALGGIAGSLLIKGGLDTSSAIVSGGTIGSTSLGTQFNVKGDNLGILAAMGAMNFASGPPKGAVINNATGLSAAAIDAIFTENGLRLNLDFNALDFGGLYSILTDLAALRVDAAGRLIGPNR